jgi:hypothetical protein
MDHRCQPDRHDEAELAALRATVESLTAQRGTAEQAAKRLVLFERGIAAARRARDGQITAAAPRHLRSTHGPTWMSSRSWSPCGVPKVGRRL